MQAKGQTAENCKEDEQSWNWFLQFVEEAGNCEGATYDNILIPQATVRGLL